MCMSTLTYAPNFDRSVENVQISLSFISLTNKYQLIESRIVDLRLNSVEFLKHTTLGFPASGDFHRTIAFLYYRQVK